MTTTLYIKTTESHRVTQEPDPGDSWDRGNTATQVTLERMTLSTPQYSFEQINYPEAHYSVATSLCDPDEPVEAGESIFVVVATYSTGDTFGRDDGNVALMLATKDETKAKAFCDNPTNYRNTYESGGRKTESMFPWDGYFEYLEALTYEHFRVYL